MLFIGDSNNPELSKKIADGLKTQIIYPEITVFPDGERRIRIPEEVSGQEAVVLKSFSASVDPKVPEFCFLIDVLKQNGADPITGIVPYFPYSRADHMFRTGEGIPLEVVIHIFEAVGLQKILIVDPHSIKTPDVFKIPVIDTSALSVFATEIRRLVPDLKDVSLVTPDMGGIRRIKLLSEMLDNASYVSIEKDRDLETGDLDIAGAEGKIKKICMVVDDMFASGKTTVNAVEYLEEHGAKEIYAFATHAVFADPASEILQNCAARKIYITDSLPVAEEKRFEKLEVLSIGEVITSGLKNQ